jgi:hypothetical protein
MTVQSVYIGLRGVSVRRIQPGVSVFLTWCSYFAILLRVTAIRISEAFA